VLIRIRSRRCSAAAAEPEKQRDEKSENDQRKQPFHNAAAIGRTVAVAVERPRHAALNNGRLIADGSGRIACGIRCFSGRFAYRVRGSACCCRDTGNAAAYRACGGSAPTRQKSADARKNPFVVDLAFGRKFVYDLRKHSRQRGGSL